MVRHNASHKKLGNDNIVRADGPGQAGERARAVGEWAARSGGAVAARLVAVLESVERLPVITPAGDTPPPAPAASLHLLTKRIRYTRLTN